MCLSPGRTVSIFRGGYNLCAIQRVGDHASFEDIIPKIYLLRSTSHPLPHPNQHRPHNASTFQNTSAPDSPPVVASVGLPSQVKSSATYAHIVIRGSGKK